jgi:hypothetical protein
MRFFPAARVAVCLVLAVPFASRADETPPALAITVMLKVLTYDSAFAGRGSGDFVVLVPYGPKEEDDAREVVAAGEAVEQKAIVGRPIRFVAVPIADLAVRALTGAAVIAHKKIQADQAKSIAKAAGRLYLLALDPALVDDSFMVGVGVNAGRPQVVINVRVARAAGAEFAPAVLKVAKAVQ